MTGDIDCGAIVIVVQLAAAYQIPNECSQLANHIYAHTGIKRKIVQWQWNANSTKGNGMQEVKSAILKVSPPHSVAPQLCSSLETLISY